MTPWLRTTGLLLVLGTGAVVNPYGGPSAYGVEAGAAGTAGGGHVEATPPASASASPLRPASGPDPAHAPTHVPAHASAEPSRAGSRAGEGRERPGRSAEPTKNEDEDEGGGTSEDPAGLEADEGDEGGRSAGPVAADSASPQETAQVTGQKPGVTPSPPAHQSVTHAEDPTEPVLRILPLGSGLVLIGLGLGLAFIGLRVRRG
ncbi:hypothetical protein ABZT04_34530 [Streptomyces sp. NPDC005492]|uniref:hypothetical protein n=1 Tax=Streptomyces sp. NPDC005492 TaxID=3156883 RepID=UPI0033AE74D7